MGRFFSDYEIWFPRRCVDPYTSPSLRTCENIKISKKIKYMNHSKKNKSGGSAAAGGMNFQSCVTAIVSVHIARGIPLGWLSGVTEDIPMSIAVETDGAGDDIRLTYKDNSVAEIQVKKGLRKGKELWDSLISLAAALNSDIISYGVLVVCPNSSDTIGYDLANDIKRMAGGREDDLKALGKELQSKLLEKSLNIEKVCSRLRIVTVRGLDSDFADVKAAHAELAHLCTNVQAAWDHIYADSHFLIQIKSGHKSSVSIFQLLRSKGITLRSDVPESPLAILHRLSSWAIKTNATFEIFAIKQPLPLETAWIEMKAFVQENGFNEENDLETALKRYHSWNARSIPSDAKKIDSITIGQFVKRAVVIAGPGIGKTTLLKRLALSYAKSGSPVLRVRLRDIATRMKSGGLGFEQSIIERGLDGSGVTAEELRHLSLENLVLLCDGLDECGNAQTVTEGIINFSAGHPQCRIIITTRPIGYDSSLLKSWRHYELVPLEASSTKKHLSTLLSGIFDKNSSEFTQAISFAETQLKQRHVETVVTKSPMLLGFLLALSLKNKSVGTTRTELYRRLFELIEDAPSQRHEKEEVSSTVMVRFLEIMGWHLQLNPHETFKNTQERCASDMASELQQSRLKAQDTCEQCGRLWQDLGMLEKVRFQTDEAITFVHKTFGEYAAARYLATIEPEVQSQAFNLHSNDASWAETIKFACSMGLAEKAIDAVLNKQSKLSVDDVKRAAEFLSESEARIDNTVVTRLVDCSWNFVMSHRRWDALEAGVLLSSIAAKYPEVVGNRAKAGLSHTQPWTRLAAWACVTAAGPQYYDYQAMLDIFKALPSKDYRFERLHKGGFWIGDPRPKIIESFMLSATKAVLAFYPEPNGLAVLDEVLSQNIGQTVSFIGDMSALLKPYGIPLPKNYSLNINIPPWSSNQRENWRDHYLNLLDALDDPSALVNSDEPIGENRVLMQLSGFMDASSHWRTYAGDLWKWEFDKNADSVKEVLQAVIAISGLERDRLISEVRIHKAMLKSQDDDLSFYKGLVHVDTVQDWQLAKQFPLSLSKLETAILGRSDWIIALAANLLEQKASKEELLPILERLLENGTGFTLNAAVYLASLFDPPEILALIRKRLLGSMTAGCEVLFKKLGEFGNILGTEETFQFLQNGLLCTNPKVAIAAAEFASQVVTTESTDITALLSKACRHWLAYEEPYLVSGDEIQESPRSILVKTMLLVKSVDDNELIVMTADSRSDVRKISEEALFERLEQSEPFRYLFLNSIFERKLKLNLLTQALKKKIHFSAHQCNLIRAKLEDDDATIRYAAIPILAEPYSATDEIELYARRMTADPEQEIREMAYELLR